MALRLLSEEMVEALLARLRLLRGLPSSMGGRGRGRKGTVCAVPAADPAGDGAEVRGSQVGGGGGGGSSGPSALRCCLSPACLAALLSPWLWVS